MKLFRSLPTFLLSCCLAALASTASAQVTLTTIHRFDKNTEGSNPYAGLVFGRDGNLYGSTFVGDDNSGNPGPNAAGTIFKMTPGGVLTILHEAPPEDPGKFANAGGGSYRFALTLASDGSFYGAAPNGGAGGRGTIFKMTADGVYTVLYEFPDPLINAGNDGYVPYTTLVQGTDGNFYGSASQGGGSNSEGTVFKVTPDGAFTTLYRFDYHDKKLYSPIGNLVQARDGNFYGVTRHGGSAGYSGSAGLGGVFKLTPDGQYTELHSFNLYDDGAMPVSGLAEGPDGNLYGTTTKADSSATDGVIFKITLPGGAFTILHKLDGADDGSSPVSLLLGQDGKFYGTTASQNGATGTIFSVTTDGQFKTLYRFSGNGDGGDPSGVLAQAADGSFYGTTVFGGTNDYGTVFHLTLPPAHPAFFSGESSLGSGAYYLAFPSGNPFGYYSYLADSHYIYHFDLGYEYVFDAADGHAGVYLYDFKSGSFFYTSPSFPFPYLYDFSLNTVLYYFPDPDHPGRYNTDGVRYFVRLDNGQIFSK